ncbi:MAG: ribonuclease HI family protein [Candidatus Tagabacteria bacterium]
MKPEKIIVYADGGARGNPGPAAIGVVIMRGSRAIGKYAESIGERTNNEAEYEAVIFALKKLKHLFGKQKTRDLEIEVKMDSELVARQLSGKYKITEERFYPLFIKIWNLKMDFGNITFQEIPREKNREADKLLNEELNRENIQARLI